MMGEGIPQVRSGEEVYRGGLINGDRGEQKSRGEDVVGGSGNRWRSVR